MQKKLFHYKISKMKNKLLHKKKRQIKLKKIMKCRLNRISLNKKMKEQIRGLKKELRVRQYHQTQKVMQTVSKMLPNRIHKDNKRKRNRNKINDQALKNQNKSKIDIVHIISNVRFECIVIFKLQKSVRSL